MIKVQASRYDPIIAEVANLRPPNSPPEYKEIQNLTLEMMRLIRDDMASISETLLRGEPSAADKEFEDRLIDVWTGLHDVIVRLGKNDPEMTKLLEEVRP